MNNSNDNIASDDNELSEIDVSRLSLHQTKLPIILPVINLHRDPQVLIFDLENLKTLRNEYGILGVLIGTLSQYPQQNFFLSIPLRLFVWEVIWLVENNIGVLLDQVNYRKEKLLLQNSKGLKSSNTISLNKDGSVNDTSSTSPNFIITKNTDEIENNDQDLLHKHQINIQDYINAYLSNNPQMNGSKFIRNYHNYKYFKELKYFVSPGLKFGGDFVLYPSDPLRFHSHSVVKLNSINLNDIVVGGRLSTGVKKNFVVIEDKDSDDKVDDDISIDKLFTSSSQTVFSIEWAGFG
ncbi:hypothetical protein DFJ63DRAFT_283242 [Scheffersomyces coipomensis]|uniref:uncharacterized protein n=1 Tax=Scheffersomyces coipomensis TaxID=1788519 RepID=UPI00315D247E